MAVTTSRGMSALHKLAISSPDGMGHNTTVTLEGRPLHCLSITLKANGDSLVTAVIELDQLAVEFDGLAEVAGKIVTPG